MQEAVALLMDAVYEFCACVSPCGVPSFTRLDGQVGWDARPACTPLYAQVRAGSTSGPFKIG